MSGGDTSRRMSQAMGFVVWILALLVLEAGCTTLEERRAGGRLPFGGAGNTGEGPAGAPTRLTGISPEAAEPGAGGAAALASAELYRGTGRLIEQPGLGPPVAVTQDGGVTLNFVNAEIADVVAAILGETLGVNYEIDPRVQGTVTVRTARALPRDAVLPILEEILAARGAALVGSETLYRVMPLEAAAAIGLSGIRGQADRVDPGFGLFFYPLEFTSAQSMRGVLEPFVPPGRVLRADAARNLLIFTGTAVEARDLESLIAAFDIDRMAGMSFGLYPVRFADLPSLIAELDAVFGAEVDGEGVVRFVPVERLNAVLAVTAQPDRLDDIQTWIARLDRGEEGVGRRIYVYRVQNGRADDLADVLGQVFGAPRTDASTRRDRLAPGLEPVELARGPESALAVVTEGEAPPLGQESYAPGQPPPATAIAGPELGIAVAGDTGEIRIVADPRNNALLVWSTPQEYRMILATLRELDIVPLQALIEVTIAEVTLDDNLKYGVQWFFRAGDTTNTFSALTSGAVAPSFPGFSYFLSGTDVQVALNALTEITDVRVISSPQILVLDNQSARLQIGDEVPIAVQSVLSIDDPAAPVVSTIEYRDTGVILEVTPRVNAGGLVVLDVMQEVSDVTETTSSTLNSPTISQRRIESTIAVQSGETIALGGLIRDTRTTIVTGIPLLANIPILGNLFKSTSDRIDRTELLVLLTPRVVRDLQDARDLTEEMRRRLPGIDAMGDGEAEGGR